MRPRRPHLQQRDGPGTPRVGASAVHSSRPPSVPASVATPCRSRSVTEPVRGHPRHRAGRRCLQRDARRPRGPRAGPRLLPRQAGRARGPVRARAVHDDRRDRGRQAPPAAVLGRVGAPTVSDTQGYELFVRHVPVVRFTTALWRLPVGQRMRMIGPKGKFMLEPDDERTHLYVSTGTGIAPFIVDDPRDDGPGQAAHDRAPQRRLVLGRAGLPRRSWRPGSRIRPTA